MKVVIAGAGPAGLLLAHYLIRREGQLYDVHIYERRSAPGELPTTTTTTTTTTTETSRKSSSTSGRTADTVTSIRTFPIGLQQNRALKAIRHIPGLDTALERLGGGKWTVGMCLHTASGKKRLVDRPPALSIDRHCLTYVLWRELVRTNISNSNKHHPRSSVTFHYNMCLQSINPTKKQVIAVRQDDASPKQQQQEQQKLQGQLQQEQHCIAYDVLVIADGARSTLRDDLSQQGLLHYEQVKIVDDYKAFYPLARSMENPADHDNQQQQNPKKQQPIVLESDRVHGWMFPDGRQAIMVLLDDDDENNNTNNNGKDGLDDADTADRISTRPALQCTGVFIFPEHANPFDSMTSIEDVHDYFRQVAPQSLSKLVTDEEALALWQQRPVSSLWSVQCDRLHVNDSIVLLGDAAHAVSASLGQGCNAALEDVRILCACLDESRRTHDPYNPSMKGTTTITTAIRTTVALSSSSSTSLSNDDWGVALPAFTAQRLPCVHALRYMSDYSTPRTKWMRIELILRIILAKLLPSWLSRWLQLGVLPMTLLSTTDLTYSQVLDRTRWWNDRVKRSLDLIEQQKKMQQQQQKMEPIPEPAHQ